MCCKGSFAYVTVWSGLYVVTLTTLVYVVRDYVSLCIERPCTYEGYLLCEDACLWECVVRG